MKRTLLAIFIIIIMMITHPEQAHAKLVVIAHPDVSVTSLAQSKLKQMYLNRSKKWQDGSRIHLTILSDDDITIVFIDKYLGKSASQFERYWKRQLFSGKGIPPEYFKTEQELLNYIRTTKGAIGFIDCETVPPGVAVIKLIE